MYICLDDFRESDIVKNEILEDIEYFYNSCMEDVSQCTGRRCEEYDRRCIVNLSDRIENLVLRFFDRNHREEKKVRGRSNINGDHRYNDSKFGNSFAQKFYDQKKKPDSVNGSERNHDYDNDYQTGKYRRQRSQTKDSSHNMSNNSGRNENTLNVSQMMNYIPPGESLISRFPLQFSTRDCSLKENHYNRIQPLNMDEIPNTLDQSTKMYEFLEKITLFKNQVVEFSQRNLVGLIMDRLKNSTIISQLNDLYENMYAENSHVEKYHCFYAYSFLEKTYCKPVLSIDTIQDLMARQLVTKPKSVHTYIQKIKPLAELWAKNINQRYQKNGVVDMVQVTTLKESFLKERLLKILPKNVLAALQGQYGPRFKSVSVKKLLEKLSELEFINDVRQNREINNMFVDEDDSEENIDMSDVFEINNLERKETGYRRNGKFRPLNPNICGVPPNSCFKCGEEHMMRSRDCPYFNYNLPLNPCNYCSIGLHAEENCVKKVSKAKELKSVGKKSKIRNIMHKKVDFTTRKPLKESRAEKKVNLVEKGDYDTEEDEGSTDDERNDIENALDFDIEFLNEDNI